MVKKISHFEAKTIIKSLGGYDYFFLLLGKSSIWFIEKHISKLTCAPNYVNQLKDFEAKKARKSAIWPWLSWQYTDNMLMDGPCKNVKLFLPIGSETSMP